MTITLECFEGVEDQLDKHVNPSGKLVEDFNVNFTTTKDTSTISKNKKENSKH